MKLSQRAINLPVSSTLAVMNRAKAMRREGVDVLSFAAGEPDFSTPDVIKRAAIDALADGVTGYMPTQGDFDARDAIARKLRERNGIDGISADHVLISNGGKMCLYLAYQALLDPEAGQEAIILTPAWVSYRPQIELAGGVVVEIPAPVERDFKITADDLRRTLTERSRVITINSPSNPCGITYTRAELRDLAQVIVDHNKAGGDVVVLSDEIYEHIVFDNTEFASFAACHEEIGRYTITLNGLSKAFAMTGWRVGYAACPPTEDGTALVKAMTKLQAQTTTCITSFSYRAIVTALEDAAADVQMMRDAFSNRAKVAYGLASEISGFVCPRPTGAFYLFPDVSEHFGKISPEGKTISSALDFAEALLAERQVAVVPGEDFGGCGANHIRISFACGEEQIREGMHRLCAFVDGLQQPATSSAPT